MSTHYIETKLWDLCGLRPHNLLIDCNHVLSTEPTDPHCESLSMLSYIELSFQAPPYYHNLLTRVYTLAHPLKLCIISPHFQFLVRALFWANNLLEQLFARYVDSMSTHYSESKVWDLCGLRPHNLLIDCNHVLSTEPTGPHCESISMLSYFELSFQAPSYYHNLLTRVYTLIIFFPKFLVNLHILISF